VQEFQCETRRAGIERGGLSGQVGWWLVNTGQGAENALFTGDDTLTTTFWIGAKWPMTPIPINWVLRNPKRPAANSEQLVGGPLKKDKLF